MVNNSWFSLSVSGSAFWKWTRDDRGEISRPLIGHWPHVLDSDWSISLEVTRDPGLGEAGAGFPYLVDYVDARAAL